MQHFAFRKLKTWFYVFSFVTLSGVHFLVCFRVGACRLSKLTQFQKSRYFRFRSDCLSEQTSQCPYWCEIVRLPEIVVHMYMYLNISLYQKYIFIALVGKWVNKNGLIVFSNVFEWHRFRYSNVVDNYVLKYLKINEYWVNKKFMNLH